MPNCAAQTECDVLSKENVFNTHFNALSLLHGYFVEFHRKSLTVSCANPVPERGSKNKRHEGN